MNYILFQPELEPNKPYHYAPLSLLRVAGFLGEAPKEVQAAIFDQRTQSMDLFWEQLKAADQLWMTAYTGYSLTQAYLVAREVKERYPNKYILLGGPHATELTDQIRRSPYFDGAFPGAVPIRRLPWDKVRISDYVNPETERFMYVASAGCPGVCTFCATKQRQGVKHVDMEIVRADINELMLRHNFKEAWIADATVFDKPGRALAIGKILQKHDLKWRADGRAFEIAHREDLNEVIATGLTHITVGLESGSPRVLQRMLKGCSHLVNFEKAARRLAKTDPALVSGVVLGTPGETVEDLRQTINFIAKIKEINPGFTVSTTFFKPLPGTEMSEQAAKYGYQAPDSLEGWAALGTTTHYQYQVYENSPWIKDAEQYHKLYESFISQNKDILV